MLTRFLKMHGCGNDFVVFDEREGALGLTERRAAAISDRRTGVGCDQLIVMEAAPAGSDADVFMRIRNPDGSEAGACGNATRCVAWVLSGETDRAKQVVQTVAGMLPSVVLGDGRVSVDMGVAGLGWRDVPLSGAMDTLHLDLACEGVGDPAAASMGNPHATFFVGDLDAVAVTRVGPVLERAAVFPEGANIGFVQMLGRDRMRLRVWERGAGLTLACGSGACAAAVNAVRRGVAERAVTVLVDGGVLEIAWREDGHVVMTGPVAVAYGGEINLAEYPA